MGEVFPKRRLVSEQSRSSRWLHARGNKTLATRQRTPDSDLLGTRHCPESLCAQQCKGLWCCSLSESEGSGRLHVDKARKGTSPEESWLSRLKRYSRVCGQVRAVTSV